MAVSRTEGQAESVDPKGDITDGFMQSVMHQAPPTGNIADWMAPDNGDYGSTQAQVNRPSVTKSVPVASTKRKLS